MLVLTRRTGEVVYIGTARVRVYSVSTNAFVLDVLVDGYETTLAVKKEHHETIEVDGCGVNIHFLSGYSHQGRIGIDAPEKINILRKELLNKKTSSGN